MNTPTPITLSDLTDDEVIELILSTGKTTYFEALYDRYSNKVYGKAIQMVKDVDLAQDLTHDILIKAFLKLNTFQGRSSFSTWLYQVSYTHCIDYLRKSKRMKSEELDEEHFDSGDDDPNQDQIHEKELLELRISRLWEILEEIQPEEKMFLLMKYQDNTSIRDMAEQFEMSESAVKMRLKRIRDKVRALDTLLDQKEGAL